MYCNVVYLTYSVKIGKCWSRLGKKFSFDSVRRQSQLIDLSHGIRLPSMERNMRGIDVILVDAREQKTEVEVDCFLLFCST